MTFKPDFNFIWKMKKNFFLFHRVTNEYKQFLTKEPTDQPYTSLNIDHLKNRRYKCSSSYLFQETKLIVLYDFTVSWLVLYISSKQLYCMRVRGTYWNSPPWAISRGIWPFHRIIISISLTLLILYLEKIDTFTNQTITFPMPVFHKLNTQLLILSQHFLVMCLSVRWKDKIFVLDTPTNTPQNK